MAAHQELRESERLRAEYDRLPVRDPRRRLLATVNQTRMEMDVLISAAG